MAITRITLFLWVAVATAQPVAAAPESPSTTSTAPAPSVQPVVVPPVPPRSEPPDDNTTRIRWGFVDVPTLFAPPLADPRSPASGFVVRADGGAMIVGLLGGRFPIMTVSRNKWAIGFGIDGAGWFDLGLRGVLFPLLSADFLIGLPVMARYGNWSFLFDMGHISAHLGDAAANRNRFKINYSREYIQLRAARTWVDGPIEARVYGGGGVLVHTNPKGLGAFFVGTGFEVVASGLGSRFAPLIAADIQWRDDTNRVNVSAQLGTFLWSRPAWGHEPHLQRFTLRVVIDAQHGADLRGQFFRQVSTRAGVALIAQL